MSLRSSLHKELDQLVKLQVFDARANQLKR